MEIRSRRGLLVAGAMATVLSDRELQWELAVLRGQVNPDPPLKHKLESDLARVRDEQTSRVNGTRGNP